MIRDRIFFFLRSARIPCAFEKEGGRGGNCRAEGSLSKRLGVGENDEELDRKSADRRSVSRAIIPRTSGGFLQGKFSIETFGNEMGKFEELMEI